jgi:hypothetical protein
MRDVEDLQLLEEPQQIFSLRCIVGAPIQLGNDFALTPDVSLAVSNVLSCKRQVLKEHLAVHGASYHARGFDVIGYQGYACGNH